MNNPKKLWQPSEAFVQQSNMMRFMTEVNQQYGLSLSDYHQLWQWSVDNIPEFWAKFWEFADIIASKPYDQVVDDPTKMPGARWFPGAQLNFAENLLRHRG